jgi:hypothetical protein
VQSFLRRVKIIFPKASDMIVYGLWTMFYRKYDFSNKEMQLLLFQKQLKLLSNLHHLTAKNSSNKLTDFLSASLSWSRTRSVISAPIHKHTRASATPYCLLHTREMMIPRYNFEATFPASTMRAHERCTRRHK